jgi:hypothetical protein
MHAINYSNQNGVSSQALRTSNQIDWLTNAEGRIAMDFVGRFERLQLDFDIACQRLGFPTMQLLVVNRSHHKHYTTYYDGDTYQAVKQAFEKDIGYFGYRFGD